MGREEKIRLEIVDDHPSMRLAFESILDRNRYEIAAYATSVREAIGRGRPHKADVLVLDLNLRDGRGETVLSYFRAFYRQIPVLLFTGIQDRGRIQRCLDHGALGYLNKSGDVKEILLALEAVGLRRERYIGRSFRDGGEEDSEGFGVFMTEVLTKTELEVVKGLARSLVNKEIASRLGVSTSTVQVHRANLMRKLKVRGAAALTRLALRQGLL